MSVVNAEKAGALLVQLSKVEASKWPGLIAKIGDHLGKPKTGKKLSEMLKSYSDEKDSSSSSDDIGQLLDAEISKIIKKVAKKPDDALSIGAAFAVDTIRARGFGEELDAALEGSAPSGGKTQTKHKKGPAKTKTKTKKVKAKTAKEEAEDDGIKVLMLDGQIAAFEKARGDSVWLTVGKKKGVKFSIDEFVEKSQKGCQYVQVKAGKRNWN